MLAPPCIRNVRGANSEKNTTGQVSCSHHRQALQCQNDYVYERSNYNTGTRINPLNPFQHSTPVIYVEAVLFFVYDRTVTVTVT